MSEPRDQLLEALRADLPSDRDRERIRARLAAAGVFVASSVPSTAFAAGSTQAVAATGLAPKLGALSWASKLAIVAAVSAGIAAPAALVVVARKQQESAPAVAQPKRQPARALPSSAAAPNADAVPGEVEPVGRGSEQAALQAQGVAPSQPLAAARSGAEPQPAAKSNKTTAQVGSPRARAPRAQEPARVAEAAATSGAMTASSRATAVASNAPLASESAALAATARSEAAEPQPPSASRLLPERAVARSNDDAARVAVERKPEPASVEPAPERVKLSVPTPAESVDRSVPLQKPRITHAKASQLARETQLMERALGALHAHDLTTARAYLEQHALLYPEGLLRRDRERVLARMREPNDRMTSHHE